MAEERTLVVCDVGAVVKPDLSTVAALARLALVVHRLGGELCLQGASPELKELLAFTGLGTCSDAVVFAPDVASSEHPSQPPMSSEAGRGRTGENDPEEDPQ